MAKFEDFKDLINSKDYSNILMGLLMIKSGVPIKSMSLEELADIEREMRNYYQHPIRYDRVMAENCSLVHAKILNKINQRRQKLESICKRQQKLMS